MPTAELTLGADARSAGQARKFLVSTLQAWGTTAYGDDPQLILSELVTNAALHARTRIVVRIDLNSDCLRLAVTDLSPRQPTMRHYSDESTTGRGLLLVDGLARRWGVEARPEGKTVWAELRADGVKRRRQLVDTSIDLSAFPDLEDTAPGVRDWDDPSLLLRIMRAS